VDDPKRFLGRRFELAGFMAFAGFIAFDSGRVREV
jgi:hypothetical protein